MNAQARPAYGEMMAETVNVVGQNGDLISAYLVKPMGAGPYPGVILIHEAFGMVEHTMEQARKFAHHGFITIAPDLYHREGLGDPDDMQVVIQRMQSLSDAQVLGDMEGAVTALRTVASFSGKIGCIGHCSGGRHTVLLACNSRNVHAAVDCYGGRIIPDELTPAKPKAVIDMIPALGCPLLGLFGELDANPSPAHVARLEEELKKAKKEYELKMYPADAGHGFFADYRPSYRQEVAVDGWQRIFDFFDKYLR